MIYRKVLFESCPNVYKPSDDSFLLADNIVAKKGERVLDMGTGCGIQGIIASKMGGVVTSSDISEAALKCARANAKLNGADINFVKSDLFSGIKGKFHLVMFNPPYLPKDQREKQDILTKAWDGGDTGMEITEAFLKELDGHLLKNGRALLLQSSLSMEDDTWELPVPKGLKSKVIAEKPLFFEKLYLYILRC
jgi:release factor glutamine methyltransferase